MNDKRRTVLSLLLVTGIAAVLRFVRLGTRDLWLDEALSVHFAATYSITELLFQLPLVDPHPPLYYIVLRAWSLLFGTTAPSVRALSAVLGVSTVVMIFYLVQTLVGRDTALLAAIITAVAPFQVVHGQNARMYTLVAFLTVASTYGFIRLRQDRTRFTATAYIASTVLLGYTHVYGLFIIAVQSIAVLLQYRRRQSTTGIPLKLWGVLQTVTVVLLLPWIAVLLRRAFTAATGSALSWLSPPDLMTVLVTPFWWIHGGFSTGIGVIELIPPVMALLAILGAAVQRGSGAIRQLTGMTESGIVRFLTIWMIVPVFLGAVVSHLIRPVFLWRATIVAAPAYYILVARGITVLSMDRHQYIIVTLLLVVLAVPLGSYYQAGDREAWQSVTGDTASQIRSGEAVVISDHYAQAPFDYYWNRSGTPVYTVAEQPGSHVGISAPYPRISVVDLQRLNRSGVWLVLAHVTPSHRQRLVSTLQKQYTHTQRTRYRSPAWDVHPPITVHHFTDTSSGVGQQP